jgi:hypothetical protein
VRSRSNVGHDQHTPGGTRLRRELDQTSDLAVWPAVREAGRHHREHSRTARLGVLESSREKEWEDHGFPFLSGFPALENGDVLEILSENRTLFPDGS